MQRIKAVLRERLIWLMTASVLILVHTTTAAATSASPLYMIAPVQVFSEMISLELATASLWLGHHMVVVERSLRHLLLMRAAAQVIFLVSRGFIRSATASQVLIRCSFRLASA